MQANYIFIMLVVNLGQLTFPILFIFFTVKVLYVIYLIFFFFGWGGGAFWNLNLLKVMINIGAFIKKKIGSS